MIRWKKVKGWPYEVSDQGKVKNKDGVYLKGSFNAYGYLTVNLTNEDFYKKFLVHRLVLGAFVGPCPPDKEGNHKSGVKANNKYWNLEYITHDENMKHAARNGLMAHGENHTRAKLSGVEVLLIRRFVNFESYRKVAKRFNVSHQNIASIVNKKLWK